MRVLKLDDQAIASRRAFFGIGDDDLERLASLRRFAERVTDRIVEEFYGLMLAHPQTRRLLDDGGTVERLKRAQRAYFLGLFAGRCDAAYVQDRLRVGAAHERIGLAPTWYLGAYRHYLQLIREHLLTALDADVGVIENAYASLQRIVFFDIALAIDTYIAANDEALDRQRAAIRALSTPVIRVHEGILLLPLVGTVDAERANQITESVLRHTAEARASFVIIDIAGVPVVDALVANHLVRTTGAVRLLGAQVVLTGVSSQIARTIVELGVNVSSMHTTGRLSDGIDFALAMLGKAIAADVRSREAHDEDLDGAV